MAASPTSTPRSRWRGNSLANGSYTDVMRRVSSALLMCLALAAPAAAQQKEPIAPFAVDLRGAYGRHKAEPSVASDLDVEPGNLPSRTLGLVAGAHVYPLRTSQGHPRTRRQYGVAAGKQDARHQERRWHDDDESDRAAPFQTISPEISLNFGHRNGWSYISGGFFGQAKLYRIARTRPPAARRTR